jgi:hypothetical protein
VKKRSCTSCWRTWACRALRLLEGLLADRPGRVELAVPLLLLTREADRRVGRDELGFLARDRSLLPPRVDLHQGRAEPDPVARRHQDLRNLAVDLGLHGR